MVHDYLYIMEQPLISVGIIVRNEEKHIEETILNILKQEFDFSLMELIIVDGNSTDKTVQIAKKILSKTNLKNKIILEGKDGGKGHCFARNLVIKNMHPSSKYLAFIDADCIASKNWLNTLYDHIQNSSDKIAGAGGPRYIPKNSKGLGKIINATLTSLIPSGFNPAFTKRNIKYIPSIANYNAIYKADIIKKFMYDESLLVNSDDIDINYRITKAGYKFLYVKEKLIWHHETNSLKQFAKNMIRYGRGNAISMRKHKSLIRFFVLPVISLYAYILFLLVSFLFSFYIDLFLIPLAMYFIFLILGMVEVLVRSKSGYAVLTPLIMMIQHIFYGYGIFYELITRKGVTKSAGA